MATTTEAPPRAEAQAAPSRQLPADIVILAGIAVAALALALLSHAHHLQGLGGIARGSIASLLLFVVCGDALAFALVPAGWGVFVPLFSIPLGAIASGLVLTALGVAQIPLAVSLWLVLAAAIAASVLVRRRSPRRPVDDRLLSRLYPGVRIASRQLSIWIATVFVLLCVALIPAWRNGAATIYGENPDAQQVAGIAVLFQHDPPNATDYSTSINTVPPAWNFRYPIFYPLSAASNLSHYDPIRVFPSMAALLMIASALGFAVLAVKYLGAPEVAAPAIAAAILISWVVAHLGWHPYWNQLWGMALFPYAVLFGWRAVAERDNRAAVLFVLLLVALELAYPLALPYPVVIVIALLIAYRRRPRLPRVARAHAWVATGLAVLVLGPAVIVAALKLGTALGQIFSYHASLWGGDVTTLTPVGWFVGTGGGLLPALAVLAVAALALRELPRRLGIALGVVLLLLFALDVRFRTASTGAYMDFKHLSFVGLLVLVLAASATARMTFSRSRAVALAGLAITAGWTVAALHQTGREGKTTGAQVTPELFGVRSWANELPKGSSVRVDIPASGTQLWAIYMLGNHPIDAPDPVLSTTYAHAPYGTRAQYSLALRYYPSPNPSVKRPIAPILFAQDPPLFENGAFVLRRVRWPASEAGVRITASRKLVEP
jgi:hypothetical protein